MGSCVLRALMICCTGKILLHSLFIIAHMEQTPLLLLPINLLASIFYYRTRGERILYSKYLGGVWLKKNETKNKNPDWMD